MAHASICRQANGLTQRPKVAFDAPLRCPLISAHKVVCIRFRLRRRHHLTRRRLSGLDIGGFGFLQGSSFMPDSQPTLSTLFVEAFRTLAPKRAAPGADVRYYPYAGLNHTIRLRSGRVHVRLSDIFKSAPLNVHRALAFILVAKLLRRRTPPFYEKVYREYACSSDVMRASDLARRQRGRKMISSAQGSVYDLGRMFQRLNQRYFG